MAEIRLPAERKYEAELQALAKSDKVPQVAIATLASDRALMLASPARSARPRSP